MPIWNDNLSAITYHDGTTTRTPLILRYSPCACDVDRLVRIRLDASYTTRIATRNLQVLLAAVSLIDNSATIRVEGLLHLIKRACGIG